MKCRTLDICRTVVLSDSANMTPAAVNRSICLHAHGVSVNLEAVSKIQKLVKPAFFGGLRSHKMFERPRLVNSRFVNILTIFNLRIMRQPPCPRYIREFQEQVSEMPYPQIAPDYIPNEPLHLWRQSFVQHSENPYFQ